MRNKYPCDGKVCSDGRGALPSFYSSCWEQLKCRSERSKAKKFTNLSVDLVLPWHHSFLTVELFTLTPWTLDPRATKVRGQKPSEYVRWSPSVTWAACGCDLCVCSCDLKVCKARVGDGKVSRIRTLCSGFGIINLKCVLLGLKINRRTGRLFQSLQKSVRISVNHRLLDWQRLVKSTIRYF